MTLTFNPEKYKELLGQYQPKLIRTEAENQEALLIIEDLMNRQHRTPEEEELYDLLFFLVEKFEKEFYQPGASSSPVDILQFLMEQRHLQFQEIENLLNQKLDWDGLFEKRTMLTREQGQILAKFFGVDSSLFV